MTDWTAASDEPLPACRGRNTVMPRIALDRTDQQITADRRADQGEYGEEDSAATVALDRGRVRKIVALVHLDPRSRQNVCLNPGGNGRPLVILAISALDAVSALALASLKAATIRSSSICFSLATISESSIEMPMMRPLAEAVTMPSPPPAAPSTLN